MIQLSGRKGCNRCQAPLSSNRAFCARDAVIPRCPTGIPPLCAAARAMPRGGPMVRIHLPPQRVCLSGLVIELPQQLADPALKPGKGAAPGLGEHRRHCSCSGLTRHVTPGAILCTASVTNISLWRDRAPPRMLCFPSNPAGEGIMRAGGRACEGTSSAKGRTSWRCPAHRDRWEMPSPARS